MCYVELGSTEVCVMVSVAAVGTVGCCDVNTCGGAVYDAHTASEG